MKIKSIRDQIRNDIYGELECEGCSHTQKFVGYDDANYHDRVVPQLKCKSCGKSSTELQAEALEVTS